MSMNVRRLQEVLRDPKVNTTADLDKVIDQLARALEKEESLGAEITKEFAERAGKASPRQRALEDIGVQSRILAKVDQYHDLLVQQLRKWFKARRSRNRSVYSELSADEHRWIHSEYKWNELWKDFYMKNPNAKPDEIIAHMKLLQKRVGLESLDFVDYPR